MSNEYYDHGTFPAPNTRITSADMRAELDAVEAGFGKLPVLAGNAGEVVVVKADASGLESKTLAEAGIVGTGDARLSDSREWTAATVEQAEAESGTATTRRAWTAQRVRQAIAAWWASVTNIDGKTIGATTPAAGSFTTAKLASTQAAPNSLERPAKVWIGGVKSSTDMVNIPRLSFVPNTNVNSNGAYGGELLFQSNQSNPEHGSGIRAKQDSTDIRRNNVELFTSYFVSGTRDEKALTRLRVDSTGSTTFTPDGVNAVGVFSSTGLSVTGALDATGALTTAGIKENAAGNVGIGTTTMLSNAWNRVAVASANSATTYASQLPAMLTMKNTNSTAGNYSLIGIADPLAETNTVAFGGINVTPNASGSACVGAFTVATKVSGSTTLTERLRIDSAGNLGLGVVPSAWGANYKSMQLPSGSVAAYLTGQLWLGQNVHDSGVGNYTYTNTAAATRYTQTVGQHIWHTAPSGTAGNPITFAQTLAVGHGTSLALQGAASQAGTGISFPATQNASADANTLDDYEEGSWTPAYLTTSGSFTYSSQGGRYVKIGQQVTVTGFVTTSSATVGTGAVRITGLPFAINASSLFRGAGVIGRAVGFAGDMPSGIYTIENQSSFYLNYRTAANGASVDLNASDLATGAGGNELYFKLTYFV